VPSQLARLRAQPHRAALLGDLALLVQHGDDRMRRVRIELGRVRLLQLQDIPREFDRGDLHAQAQAEIGDFVFARVLRGLDFALDAAFAETAGHQDAAQALQDFLRAVPFRSPRNPPCTISTPQSLAMPPWLMAS
jgi:hypothetical protein